MEPGGRWRFPSGAKTVRYLETCQGCNWREFPTALADRRWYSTQAELPDGGFIVVGGRDAFSYEYIPREGRSNAKSFFFDFLRKTSDKDENNLYPFVHLSTDGNLFIFANDRSVLLNPKSNKVVREFPALPGGHRSYPATGMSVLLPIKLHSRNNEVIPAEVLICGAPATEMHIPKLARIYSTPRSRTVEESELQMKMLSGREKSCHHPVLWVT